MATGWSEMAAVDLIGSYNYALVALSVLIAMFASYAALDLASRVTAAGGWTRALWVLGGIFAIWVEVSTPCTVAWIVLTWRSEAETSTVSDESPTTSVAFPFAVWSTFTVIGNRVVLKLLASILRT